MSEGTAAVQSVSTQDFLAILHRPGDVFEIRSLQCPERAGGKYLSTASGYFNDFSAAAFSARRVEKLKPPGIYVTLNPVIPSLLARSVNAVAHKAAVTTKDHEVKQRRWLLVDVDPTRWDGGTKLDSDFSAAESEMQAALELARKIEADLRYNAGWPTPLFGCSGNGAYLLYRIDLPNDKLPNKSPESEGVTQICEYTLKSLAAKYDTDAARVDTGTYNAARIVKLFGTTARKKGDLRGVPGIDDRPHRVAWFEPPECELQVVPRELLEAMAAEAPEQKQSVDHNGHSGNGSQSFDAEAFIQRIGFDVDGGHEWNGGRLWNFKTSPMCEHHDKAAYIIQYASGAWSAGCHHNSCSWTERDLRERYEPRHGRHHDPHRNGNGNGVGNGKAAVAAPHAPPNWLTVASGTTILAGDRGNYGRVLEDNGATLLLEFVSPEGQHAEKELPKSECRLQDGRPLGEEKPLPPPVSFRTLVSQGLQLREPIVDGLLRRGETANVIAATKAGKSWLSGNLAIRVATGGDWLGFRCARSRVLIIDNELHKEDGDFRLQCMADAMELDHEALADQLEAQFLRGWNADLNDIIRYLENHIERGQFDLIILDAWYRAMPEGFSENDNAQIMLLYNRIDAIAERLGCAWVNIHHASKGPQGEKAVTDVGSGAGSQSRAADTHLILRPHETEGCAAMQAAVRSWAPVAPIVLKWDFPLWRRVEGLDPSRLKDAGSQRQLERDRQGTADIVEALRNGPLTHRALRRATGMSKDRLDRLLANLERDGKVNWQATEERGNPCHEYHLSGEC